MATNKTVPPQHESPKKRLLVVFGTRPEAIKLCPLVSLLRTERFRKQIETFVCVSGQHREMLAQVLQVFDVKPDLDLRAMEHNQTLAGLTAKLMALLPPVLDEIKPDMTIVQGDTTTTLCGALASFYAGIDLAHVEAGLRTFDMRRPFPEEMNRVLTARLAALHFAATDGARENLLREGIFEDSIEVTGNTGIDAVLATRDRLESGLSSGLTFAIPEDKKLIVVTAHRRENFGRELENLCAAIETIAGEKDVAIVWPVHRNPNVRKPVETMLGGKKNITLLEPLDYLPFVDLMRRAYLLITDSGGIQEEAPSLGKPVLVVRSVTERPEAVSAGTVKLVGSDPVRIVEETRKLLNEPGEYERMSRIHNPYGDGHACERIALRISSHLNAALP